MNSNKKNGRITGVLFLAAFVGGLLGIILSEPFFTESPDLLTNVSENSMQITISIFIDIINIALIIALGIMLYISLKEQNNIIALLGRGLFFTEAIMLAVSRISIFSLLQLSEEYVKAGVSDAAYFHTLGQLFVGASSSGYSILAFLYSLGGLMFFYLFFKSKLIPSFLSVWGLIAFSMILTNFVFDIFGYDLGWILLFPTVLLEPFIGIWLIVKGFNASQIVSRTTKIDISENKMRASKV